VLIAIGESLVGLGLATSVANISVSQAWYLACGLAIAVTLWWTYFDIVAPSAERTLTRAQGLQRVRIARDSYTYLHLPLIAGIESTAIGLGLVIHSGHAVAGRLFLYVGLALYLGCLSLLRRRNAGIFNLPRLLLAGVFAALAATAGVDRHIGAAWVLGAAGALMVGLVSMETYVFREARRELRPRRAQLTADGDDRASRRAGPSCPD
jgi:low temperature requirement protein LtrA